MSIVMFIAAILVGVAGVFEKNSDNSSYLPLVFSLLFPAVALSVVHPAIRSLTEQVEALKESEEKLEE